LAGWTVQPDGRRLSPPLAIKAEDWPFVAVRATCTGTGGTGQLLWAAAAVNGLHSANFTVIGDGRPHTYLVEPPDGSWSGQLVALGLNLPADTQAESAALGPIYVGPADALPRVGRPARLVLRLANLGGQPARGLSARLADNSPVRLAKMQVPEQVPPGATADIICSVTAPDAGSLPLAVVLTGIGAPPQPITATVTFSAAPAVAAPAAYVPEPRPAPTRYNIGTFYFPGWGRPSSWEPIDNVAPWRKPLLGWYDESNPECADWQIKWAVEHGVNFFLVDWYWNRGRKALDHWIEGAYAHSRYHSQLKWAVMWANHNPEGSHSEADWRAVTQYWIDHYLKTPEYLTLDGQPAIFLWYPGGVRRDMGGSAAAAKLYAISQEMAKAAGLPGIHFVSMNIAGGDESLAQVKAEGFWGETHYHGWYDAQAKAADPHHYPFSLLADRSPAGWDRRAAACAAAGMHYLPVADTGWDARPWHGDASDIISDRTPAQFERLLRAAKGWLDAHDQKTLVLGPWNEWGEGSYIEPCAEFGFAMLDAVRRVFCDAPEAHQDFGPADVGRGPYDFPQIHAVARTAWSFDTPGDSQGWDVLQNLRDFAVRDGVMRAVSTTDDPSFHVGLGSGLAATAWPYLVVEMSISANPKAGALQLFWAGAGRQMSEAASIRLPFVADGQMHRYVFDLGHHPRWRGVIRELRLDPGDAPDLEARVKSIALSATQP
jgi:hypothetical protein